jgi:hypothetical protein
VRLDRAALGSKGQPAGSTAPSRLKKRIPGNCRDGGTLGICAILPGCPMRRRPNIRCCDLSYWH